MSVGTPPAQCLLDTDVWLLSPRFNSEDVCTCPQASVPQQFASVPWNSFDRDVLKALYGFAPISMHCNKSTAVRFQVCRPGSCRCPPLPAHQGEGKEPSGLPGR